MHNDSILMTLWLFAYDDYGNNEKKKYILFKKKGKICLNTFKYKNYKWVKN
jgi:hypothetical protein